MPDIGNAEENGPDPPADGTEFRTAAVITIAGGHAVHDTYTAFLPPLLPAFITRWALTRTEAGLLSVFLQAPSLLQPFIGHLADRRGLRYLVILGPALASVTMSLLGVAPGYAAAALLLLVAGLVNAGFHAVAPVKTGILSGRGLGRGLGFFMLGGELGRTLGPILVVSVVAGWSLGHTVWLMPLGFIASAVLYVQLRGITTHTPHTQSAGSWRKALSGMGPVMLPLVGIVFVRSLVLVAITTYLAVYLSERGVGLWFAGASLTVLEGAGVVGAISGGWISDRLGRRPILVFSQLLTPVLLLLFLWAHGSLLVPILVCIGFSALCTGPVLMALVQESFPRNRALANGIFMLINFIVRSGAIILVGAGGDFIGLTRSFAIGAVLMFAGTPLIALLPAKRLSSPAPPGPEPPSETELPSLSPSGEGDRGGGVPS